MEEEFKKHPKFWAIVLLLAICVIGVILYFIIPPAIKAVGAAFGIAGSIITTGVIASAAGLSWVMPVGAAGLALFGGAVTYKIIVNIVKVAEKEPYKWILPVLGILAGFTVNICSEFFPGNGVAKIAFSATTGLLYIMGGLLFHQPKYLVKLIGILLFLLAPFYILWEVVTNRLTQGFLFALKGVDIVTWVTIGILIIILIATVILAYFIKEQKKQTNNH